PGWEQALRLGIKIAGALETAHRVGTLHRDVKPANILLTDYDEPQLTDFGIARIPGGFETTRGAITGSPAFTAPEVLEGRPPTVASDVYSLGSTLFCSLTGHAAFERHSGEQVIAQFLRISAQPVPDLRTSDIPDDVCAAVERAMSRAVDKRPAGAADFGNELRQVQRRHGLHVDDLHIPTVRVGEEANAGAGTRETAPSRTPWAVPPEYPMQPPPTPPVPVTKFRPPTTTRQLVRRDRLLDMLRAGGERRLTLVHAPAGFGKSSLVAQWRDELIAAGTAVAWLTVDRDDDNVVWFLSHLVEAIQRVRPEVIRDLGQALEEHGQAVERFVLTSLINRLHDSDNPLVVVIDDWHQVTATEPIAAMEFLLDNGCHHLPLVVSSRSRSNLPLSRLRVRDELCEIGPGALSFDFFESLRFFGEAGPITLSDSEVEDLRVSTDGWVAALQLASLSLRDAGDATSLVEQFREGDATLGEYLTENVLDSLEPDVLDFVLATAVPDRVCGDLASALADVPDGAARLERVVARDLFLDRTGEDRQWYRYHNLFAQVLRQRLERDQPGRIAQLHHTAAAWFRERRMLGEALDHLLAAGDRQGALELLEHDDLYLLDRSQMSTLLGLIAKLPADLVPSSPRLQLTIGWANTELQRIDVAVEARRHALELLDLLDLPADVCSRMRVEADVLQAEIDATTDRVAAITELVDECLTNPTEQHPFVVSMAALLATVADTYEFRFRNAYRRQTWAAPYHSKTTGPYTVAYGYCYAGLAKAEQLDFTGAIELYRRAFRLVRDAGNTQSQHARLSRALLAEMLYQQNQITEADELLSETFEPAALGGAPDFMIRHYCLRARILSARGDRVGAANELDEGIRTADRFSLPRVRAAVDNERVRLGLPPRPGFVAVTRTARPEPVDGIEQITAQLEDETAILLLLRTGDPTAIQLACDWADEWVQTLAGTGRELARLHAMRLQVSCLWADGRPDDAKAALLPLAVECARHELIRFLVDGGPDLVDATTSLRTQLAAASGSDRYPDPPDALLDTVLAAVG
ncbi:serine/threonine-protein kinase, partial [Rhodococcus opacus]